MVIEEEWFDDINLTDGATFSVYLIKREISRFSQKINFLPDTKRRIRLIVINYGWNTHIVQILQEIRDRHFRFKGKFLSRLPKPVGLPTT